MSRRRERHQALEVCCRPTGACDARMVVERRGHGPIRHVDCQLSVPHHAVPLDASVDEGGLARWQLFDELEAAPRSLEEHQDRKKATQGRPFRVPLQGVIREDVAYLRVRVLAPWRATPYADALVFLAEHQPTVFAF